MAAPNDPLNFVPADIFFPTVANFDQVQKAVSVESSSPTGTSDPLLRYAAHVTLQGTGQKKETHCLVQFVTPQIWRIRYNPKFDSLADFTDENSRTIVRDSFAKLVDDLQDEYRDSQAKNSYTTPKDWRWETSFEKRTADHWVLTTLEFDAKNPNGKPNTRLHFLASPFRIVATRVLEPMEQTPSYLKPVGALEIFDSEHVIWQTGAQAFSFQGNQDIPAINNVVLNIKKPTPADYLGFGEQGGRTVLKKPTFMNYFCYDNYNYTKVYGKGALDPKEPLYHSTPFYLEMNGTPAYRNVTGVMVDNYSQVAIDLGKTNSGNIGVATRFGTFDAYIMTADNVPKMIWQYTSIVGRPRLKPRFILGHHQASYGYHDSMVVGGIVEGYRNSGIPLDGMHIDIDLQDRYRTFTVDGINFPNIGDFLGGLRRKGVKCCTNITPILSLRENDNDQYVNLRNFWDMNDKLNPATNLLVADKRNMDGLPSIGPRCTRYDVGPKGVSYPNLQVVDPNALDQRMQFADWDGAPPYTDNYIFIQGNPGGPEGNYNSGYPFHGGVSYGEALGTPGYYPDLNRAVARDVWGQQYQYLFDKGLEFIWQDMTTPSAALIYGDMLGFPSRLLMSEDPYEQDPKVKPPTKTAIELWALFSYNLHKATYNGLNKLKGRENKRNFVLGRGSLTGMHRFAGLWTGDNASSWDFWKISVAQVLALGYSGMTIAGVDMGGFTPDPKALAEYQQPRWCDPELLTRWYTGAFLLPWYRNHYNQTQNNKVFQEPWQYTYVYKNYPNKLPGSAYNQYMSVEPLCRYYVQLRYSLMQVLYDTMFSNLINGLPIARAMLITDPEDTTLFNANDDYIDTQYLLGHNILVCPVLDPGVTSRDVYLPGTDIWFPNNLQVQDGVDPLPLKHAARLDSFVAGGTSFSYGCALPTNPEDIPGQVPYITPVYIRGGAIIPQIDYRQSVEVNDYNPPVIHIYPSTPNASTTKGKRSEYDMYLDDGVSRDSAPIDLPQYKYANKDEEWEDTKHESEAKGFYRQVNFVQDYSGATRVVQLTHKWDGFDPLKTVGNTYHLALWACPNVAPVTPTQVTVSFRDEKGNVVTDSRLKYDYDVNRSVLMVEVPVDLVPSLAGPESDGTPGSRFISVNASGLN